MLKEVILMRAFFALILSWVKKLLHIRFVDDPAKDDPTPGNTEPIDDPSADPGPAFPDRPDPNEYVCYYGCPNSKRAQRLQLSRKPIK